jgi:hypothetical protein
LVIVVSGFTGASKDKIRAGKRGIDKSMREERVEAAMQQLYQGPHVTIADFATSGHQGA